MKLEFNNLTISPRNKNILYKKKYFPAVYNATGSVQSGEILAIIGPIGAGKSSFLKALSCRVPYDCKTSGEILLDDKPINSEEWMKMCSLIKNSDEYFDNLHADEMIKQVTTFRAKKIDFKTYNERCNYYKSRLYLQNCCGKKIVDLSLDEKKRLMILCEIMCGTEIICIDEPTAEMDSTTAFNFLVTLKELAINENKIIILALNQPSEQIYDQMDKVALINEGSVLFCGVKEDLLTMLEDNGISNSAKMSTPEFILDVFNKKFGYEEHGYFEKEIENITNQNIITIEPKEEVYKGNNAKVYFKPSIEDITTLIMRKTRTNYGSLFQYFKYFYIKLVFLIVLTIVLVFVVEDRKNNIGKHIPNYLNIPENVQKDEAFIKLTSNLQKSNLVFFTPSIISLFSIHSLITAFYFNSKTIIRELSNLSYSITSYYFATLIYEIIAHIVPIFVVYTFVQIGFYDTCSIHTPILFMTSIIILAPFILLIGSFLNDRRSTIFYSIMLAFLIVIPPMFVIEQLRYHKISLNIGKLSFNSIYFLIPSHYYTHFFGQLALQSILKALKEKFEIPETKDLLENISEKIEICKNFGTNVNIPTPLLLIIPLIISLVCIFLNILVLRIKFKPEIRTAMSKNFKKKTKKLENTKKNENVENLETAERVDTAEDGRKNENSEKKEKNTDAQNAAEPEKTIDENPRQTDV